MRKSKGSVKKIKKVKPRMSKEELQVWYAKRKKTSYHKSKKDYDRKDKGWKENEI